MTDVLSVATKEQVTLLTLNPPEKLNALNNELLGAIHSVLDRIELDPAVRVVVITGAGRAFSAGADIAAFQRHMKPARPRRSRASCDPGTK